MMASISTSALRGNSATPTAARAGYGVLKYCAMISLTRGKNVIEVTIDGELRDVFESRRLPR